MYKGYNKWVRKLSAYQTCSKRYKEPCENGYCVYAVLNLDGEKKTMYFTCGRNKIEEEKSNASK